MARKYSVIGGRKLSLQTYLSYIINDNVLLLLLLLLLCHKFYISILTIFQSDSESHRLSENDSCCCGHDRTCLQECTRSHPCMSCSYFKSVILYNYPRNCKFHLLPQYLNDYPGNCESHLSTFSYCITQKRMIQFTGQRHVLPCPF